ncbi:MAG: CopG family transcriptional regulator [Deltaproteobacteria bacterium]|nr:CopG family transcriptional regulator [Deltaproteobacteria bacterium]
MESQMIVRIDSNIKDKFSKIVRMEGKSSSEKIREMIENYISQKDFAAVVDRVWNNISAEFKKREISEGDIENVIKKVRASKKR